MTQGLSKQAKSRPLARRVAVALGALAVLLLAVVLYGMKAPGGKETAEGPAACPASSERAALLKPLAHGELAALSLAAHPKPLPELTFKASDGTPTRLSDFQGREVLLNLWATWCVPCRQEMPALDRLQGLLGSKDFVVVAVNIDTAKLDRPKAFLTEIGVKNLAYYSDATADVFQALKQAGRALGLPTTILIGKDGCEIGTMAGPAQWDSQDALALLRAGQG
ncbi:thiol:disulfide interchange protein TlpA [Methylocapsa aurea]|uniref:thiol:disulfide interchange protein TlpA n=1 Tax=Methylocapsa aurea TaxID=663610 RepID=UPI00056482A4|nr:TlpA disulfide reductase family protein [Methylocapsa aurea]